MQTAGSRRRIHLQYYNSYEEALAAKKTEQRYPQDSLQIKKRPDGKFDLMARISVNTSTNKNVENN